MAWLCDKADRPVVSIIKVDGSDACDCESCRRHALVQSAIGTADAGANGLADARRYIDPRQWNDLARADSIVEIYRKAFARMSDELRQAVGDRPLATKH
jgi:hypothetical protein